MRELLPLGCDLFRLGCWFWCALCCRLFVLLFGVELLNGRLLGVGVIFQIETVIHRRQQHTCRNKIWELPGYTLQQRASGSRFSQGGVHRRQVITGVLFAWAQAYRALQIRERFFVEFILPEQNAKEAV